jgi:hypothetical protein
MTAARGRRMREEQETIIRWDRSGPDAVLYTAAVAEKRRWEARGYAVAALGSGWTAKVPIRAVSLRRLPLRTGNRTGGFGWHAGEGAGR